MRISMYVTRLRQPLFIVMNVRKVSRASHLFWAANVLTLQRLPYVQSCTGANARLTYQQHKYSRWTDLHRYDWDSASRIMARLTSVSFLSGPLSFFLCLFVTRKKESTISLHWQLHSIFVQIYIKRLDFKWNQHCHITDKKQNSKDGEINNIPQ